MAPFPDDDVWTPVFDARDTVVTVISIIDSPTETASTPKPAKKVAIGPIVGGLVGGVAAGLLLTALVVWYIGYRKRRREEALAIIERRQRRLASQRRAKSSRQSLASTRASTSGSNSRLFGSSRASGLNFDRASGLNFDPSVPVAAPRRPTNSYAPPKQYDQFANNEKHYGYEPQPLAYVHTGGEYFVQVPYEQPSMRTDVDRGADGTEGNAPSSNSSNSSTSPPSSAKRTSRRSNPRVLSAEKAALSIAMPATSRHRPTRPSPLSAHAAKMGDNSVNFATSQGHSQGHSPTGSSSNNSTGPPSYDSHAYASAASGAWGIALGDPESDQYAGREKKQAVSKPRKEKSASGQYSADPFAEYHIYESGLGLYDEEHLNDGDADGEVIDFSQHAKY